MVREHKWIACGRAGRPFGVRGELVVDWLTGSCPVEAGRSSVYIREGGDAYRPLIILSSRPHGKRYVIRVEGFATRNDAEALRNEMLYISADQLEALPEGHYYDYQIIGLAVVTVDGEDVGTITDVQRTGANDIYEVTPPDGDNKKSFYIPAVDYIVKSIDLEKRVMVINVIEGLVEDVKSEK